MEKRHDEINLFDFIITCKDALVRFCKFLLNTTLRTIRLSIQYIWIVVVCGILGVLLGFYMAKPTVAEYKYEATITFNEGMRSHIYSGLRLFFTTSYNTLEEKYGVSEEMMRSIDRVDYFNVVDANVNASVNFQNNDVNTYASIYDNTVLEPDFVDYSYSISARDSVNTILKDRIHLSLKMSGEQDINVLKKAMTDFMNDQPSIVAADEYTRAINAERLRLYDKEVARLDSFSTYAYFERDRVRTPGIGSNTATIYQEKGEKLIYDALVVMMRKRDFVKSQVEAAPEIINFQTDFVPEATLSRGKKIVFGGMFGYALALIIALLWKYRKEVKDYMKK